MMLLSFTFVLVATLALSSTAYTKDDTKKKVFLNNFPKAETHMAMRKVIKDIGSIGKMYHEPTIKQITSADDYQIVRTNLDTLYSFGVFDLNFPVTFELAPNNNYYMSLYAIDENHYSVAVVYPNSTRSTKVTFVYKNANISEFNHRIETSNTRYIFTIIRTLADPNNGTDLARARALQNAVNITQASKGMFEGPSWDIKTLLEVRAVAASLANYLEPHTQMLGYQNQISNMGHLAGTAAGWGGLPNNYATYEFLYPPSNDTSFVFQITVTTVPIRANGFWSVTVYNATGFLEYNKKGSYSLNSLTVKPEPNGSYIIYFSKSKQDYMTNWIWIYPGWNYLVRLYEPTESIVNGSWKFPSMTQVVPF